MSIVKVQLDKEGLDKQSLGIVLIIAVKFSRLVFYHSFNEIEHAIVSQVVSKDDESWQ